EHNSTIFGAVFVQSLKRPGPERRHKDLILFSPEAITFEITIGVVGRKRSELLERKGIKVDAAGDAAAKLLIKNERVVGEISRPTQERGARHRRLARGRFAHEEEEGPFEHNPTRVQNELIPAGLAEG